MNQISTYLTEMQHLLGRLPVGDITRAMHLIAEAFFDDRQVFLMGNGGSAATASHFACDLAKSTITSGRRRFRVISLTDNVPLITAWANDWGYEDVFAEQLANLVNPGDLVIAISGSGNSPNVLRAIELARDHAAMTIGLTGFDGGKLAGIVDVCIVVPSQSMPQIEDVHLILQHLISSWLYQLISSESAVSLPRQSDPRESAGPCEDLERARVLTGDV